MDRGIRKGEKENPRCKTLKAKNISGIFDARERQAPVDYIVLQVTNPRISVCTSPDACIPLSLFSLRPVRRKKKRT